VKAAVYLRYGGPEVIELAEVPKPVPKDNEILVRVHAATVTAFDRHLRSLKVPFLVRLFGRLTYGWRRPSQPILGREFSGVVEALGSKVAGFRTGDAVFGSTESKGGAHAEYCIVSTDGVIAIKPASMGFVEAAAMAEGGPIAIHCLRAGNVRSGESVLILGASGAIGSALVQLAAELGAVVTAVSNGDPAMVTALGAKRVVTSKEFRRGHEIYDVIVDAAGWTSFVSSRHALNGHGRFIVIKGNASTLLAKFWAPMVGRKRVVIGLTVRHPPEDLEILAQVAAAGRFRPLVDQVHDFARIRDAHVRVEQRRSHGSVVVRMVPDEEYAGTAEGRMDVLGYDLSPVSLSDADPVAD
jgi:NADPH:quinone reductase-like Zn-dependent oxidoreductase